MSPERESQYYGFDDIRHLPSVPPEIVGATALSGVVDGDEAKDPRDIIWRPPRNRLNFISDVFGAPVYNLDMSVAEAAVLVEVIEDRLRAQADDTMYRSPLSIDTRVDVVKHYLEGKTSEQVARLLKLKYQTVVEYVPHLKTQMLSYSTARKDNLRAVVEKLAALRGEASAEIINPRELEAISQIIPFRELHLEEGVILGNDELASALIHLTNMGHDNYELLRNFFREERNTDTDTSIRKESEKRLIYELRQRLLQRIDSIASLGLPMREAAYVRRILGGELDPNEKVALPTAIRDFVTRNGGHDYDLSAEVKDAFSNFTVRLAKQVNL